MAPKGTKAQKTADAAKTVDSDAQKAAESSSGSTDEQKSLMSLKNWFKYATKEGSDDAKKWAEIGRAEYKACNSEERRLFLEKFMATKDDKNKGWMRNFKELKKNNSCAKYFVEKYHTRH